MAQDVFLPEETSPHGEVYTVSRLNSEVHTLLESEFPLLWVEGEVSNLARPSSGHWYFSLKDPQAQVRCAMFRNRNQYLNFKPRDGLQVLIRARISLYEARGEYQLIAEHMEEAGHGALQRAFEALKQRLAAEGLFDAAHKRPLPRFPRRVGVITSPTGAAIRDVLSVLRRRYPALPVLVYPVPVQGEGAGERIAQAIRTASQRQDCDVLILTRGGGSLEDLWAFNEEVVARAIYDCQIPLVCGVGHEIDVTIADFAADMRAPTPSAAAELVSPDAHALAQQFARQGLRLHELMAQRLRAHGQQLQWLSQRLEHRHPSQRLQQSNQRLDELERRLQRAMDLGLANREQRLARLTTHFSALSPARRMERLTDTVAGLELRLRAAVHRRMDQSRARLEAQAGALNALSPLATLGRGYAIVRRERDGTIVRRAREVETDEQVSAQLGEGKIICRVEKRD